MSTKAIVKRDCFSQLVEERDDPAVSILVGPRQVGKTTLLKELRTYFEARSQSVLYLNLENPLDLQKLPPNETDLITWLMAYQVILIDELYYIKNISRIFKIIVDAGQETGIKIYASGSSAIDIHKHLEESLAGRRLVTRIFPLVFSEFCLAFPTTENPKADLFETFLTYGGLPGLLHTEPHHRSRLLREMLETYIQKDIKAFVKEENIRNRSSNRILDTEKPDLNQAVVCYQFQGKRVSYSSTEVQ
jgi:predicted AAA+ superfamily ATPase